MTLPSTSDVECDAARRRVWDETLHAPHIDQNLLRRGVADLLEVEDFPGKVEVE